MNQRLILPLFSAPVYVNNVGDFARPNVKALQYTSSLPDGSVFNFATSVDTNVLDLPEFGHVRALVQREVNIYVREVLRVVPSIEFYVTNSWVNIHRRGQSAGAHTHHNSLISGVLYLAVNEQSGDLVFHRDGNSLVPFPPALDLDMEAFNIYNCKSWGHTPRNNDICLFPSVLMHSVEANLSDEERCCLAFNVFVRGDIGALHKLHLR